MKIFRYIKRYFKCLNEFYFGKYKYNRNKINLINFEGENFGDAMSKDIVEFMLNKKNLSLESKTRKKYVFLSALGSLFQRNRHTKKTIWGSGSLENVNYYPSILKHYSKLDIRCLRGPLTEKLLIETGVLNNNLGVYGDPGLLVSAMYPLKVQKKYKISVIPHFKENITTNLHLINARTYDWKFVAKEIAESELVLSSSLHGIIVAEAYGVPAIWIHNNESHEQIFKFLDYYYSTGRCNPICANSIDEALNLDIPEVPNFNNLRDNLLNTFPYDLWVEK